MQVDQFGSREATELWKYEPVSIKPVLQCAMWAIFYFLCSCALGTLMIILLAGDWWKEYPLDSLFFSAEIALCVMVGYLSSGARNKTISTYWFRSVSSYYARFRVPTDGTLGVWTCTIVDSSDDPSITPCFEQCVGNIELEVQLGGWFGRGRCVIRENGQVTHRKNRFGRWEVGFRIETHHSNGMLVTLRGISKKGCDGLTLKLQDAFKFLVANAWRELGEVYQEAIGPQTVMQEQIDRANENALATYADFLRIEGAILETDRLKTTLEGRELRVLILEQLRHFVIRTEAFLQLSVIDDRLEVAQKELEEARRRSRRRAAA